VAHRVKVGARLQARNEDPRDTHSQQSGDQHGAAGERGAIARTRLGRRCRFGR
jgi:hypothetical protein